VASALAAIDELCNDPYLLTEDLLEARPIQIEIHLAAGDIDGAADIAAQPVHETRESKFLLYLVEALIAQGEVFIPQGRLSDATASLEEALALARDMPNLYAEARALYQLGRATKTEGGMHAACDHLDEALALFRRLGASRDVERSEEAIRACQPDS
jgi:tetratricopeptide (TPR) repeat protein